MRSATTCLCLTAVLLAAIIQGRAQERPATASTTDPRVGLKAGFKDAGEASKNMERIANLPKPEGFFDPKAPSGNPAPPERPETPEGAPAGAAGEPAAAGATPGAPAAPRTPPPFDPVVANRPGFTNSDLAFRDHHVFVGNYHGFNTYDIERPSKPKLSASVVCPGGQGDVSVHGNLLFMSVEQTRGRLDCGTQGVQTAVSAERFRGVRIFDISDMSKPKQVAAIQTCRGSHTHTLVTDPGDKANLYVYGSGTSGVRSGEELTGCSNLDPDKDPRGSGYQKKQSQIAVGSGGLTGKGYGQGTQTQLGYLPARQTDFIFSVLAEEFGFMGVVGTLGLYLALLWRCLDIARLARDRLGLILVACLTATLTFQVVYNVGMVAGLLPVKGLPLPLMSAGRSSVLATFISIGLILSVRMRRFAN